MSDSNHLSHPRTLKYDLDSPILALSANVDGDRIVIAGREIIRILRVGFNDISEAANLRLPGEQKRHFQYDVKWGPNYQKNIIATAGTNGTICLYDIKEGRLDRTLKEHGRQVHRIAFNQANGNLLLSASQDGTIKLWDMREKKSRHTFVGKADAVRDVQFNGRNATEFAAAFDSGAIQKWDYRKESIYERKINAHNGPVFVIDWHPDGRHCASGGRDRTIKVWDFTADARRQAKHTITTMASVSRIAWRPLKNANTETTQLASCAISNDHRVQIWDFKRPFIPTRILDAHTNSTTGMLWRDDDLLWSCSKDSTLIQNDVPFAPKPIHSLTHNAFAWAPDGGFTFAAQRRKKSRHHGTPGARVTFDLDEDIIRDERRSHDRSSSFRSSRPTVNPINIFDTALEKFVPSQTAARVSMPCLFDKEAFDFFAERYVIDINGVAGGRKMTLSQACERNARIAWRAQKYRTSKSWKMIQLSIASEEAAAERARTQRPESISSQQLNTSVPRRVHDFDGNYSVSATGGTTPMPARSPKSMPIQPPERIDEQLLRIPPAAFGISPSSSTISTDGENSSPDCKVAEVHSDSDGPDSKQKQPRPNLTVDTNTVSQSQIKSYDFATQNDESSNGNGMVSKGHNPRPSMDENHYLPLLTSTTERTDPLGTSMSSYKLPSNVDINNDSTKNNNHTNHQHSTSSSIGSPNLPRQSSAVSEQTSSSYGVLESTRSDLSDSVSPKHYPTEPTSVPLLPPITEEMHNSTILSPPPEPSLQIPILQTPGLETKDLDASESEKPWSAQNLANQLLTYSINIGDIQTAAVLILLLHQHLSPPQHLIEEVLDGYLNLLTRSRLFSAAALVRKLAPSETLKMNAQFGVDVDLSCGECGRAVGGRGGGWCEKCARRGGAECVICGEVGKGRRWTVCANCGHGGCDGCVRGWFFEEEEDVGGMENCPAVGCACVCLPR
ncbi:WD40 repeat-like protein [Wilcoxina mikolae CBS 423.85]|nr:WD40 repeat-like protein [Wilcoxina mikolae CBS 423.85]